MIKNILKLALVAFLLYAASEGAELPQPQFMPTQALPAGSQPFI